MATTTKMDVKEKDLLGAVRGLLGGILTTETIAAILVPQYLPMKNMVMPTLVTDPERLDGVDPLAPAFPMNAAKIASRLTRKPTGAKIAAVMRPCEIRAFVELVKLKQGRTDEVVLIGMDCLGAYQNKDYFRFIEQNREDSTVKFYRHRMGGNDGPLDGIDLAPACKACEYPVAAGADLIVGLYGMDVNSQILIQSQSEVGQDLLARLELPEIKEPAARQGAVDDVVKKCTAHRNEMFVGTREATDSVEKLSAYFATCVNCYNCRVACPVCYCKECVFVTDVFNHDPSQYLSWASRKGIIKMPTDTVFYHMTRLTHMSTACVGCGQCSNACPNDIPVMELFRTIAQDTQQAFGYEAGRSLEEEPPMSVFREDEFPEVVGIKN